MPRKRSLNKKKYRSLVEELRVKLVNAQYDLKNSDTSVILLLAGNDLPGCEEFIDVMQEWVDMRYVDTRAFRRPRKNCSIRRCGAIGRPFPAMVVWRFSTGPGL